MAAAERSMYRRSSIRSVHALRKCRGFAFIFFSSIFQSLSYLGQWSAVLINFPNTGALRQSGNPSRTVGNGHSNNNNTKSNLNYALKRLGQNNPQNKHKAGRRGGGSSWSNTGRGAASPVRGCFYSWWRDLRGVVFDLGCSGDDGVYFEEQQWSLRLRQLLLLKCNKRLPIACTNKDRRALNDIDSRAFSVKKLNRVKLSKRKPDFSFFFLLKKNTTHQQTSLWNTNKRKKGN